MADDVEFKLIAGHVALDFANTLDNRFDAVRTLELLAGYKDLLRFCEQSGVISATEASCLRGLSEREQQATLRAARELRELIEQIFSAVARGGNVAREDLSSFNAFLEKALQRRQLAAERRTIQWEWKALTMSAMGPLWPITLAAAELLASSDRRFVRECHAETCRWLFLDMSKNHSRRWCDMKVCGNRTKARRYYRAHV